MPFDGDYIGASKETTASASGAECPPKGVPADLMIRGGVVLGYWQGVVDPQGVLVVQDRYIRVEGQIDSHGTIRAQGTNTAGCVRTFAWQKGWR